MTADLYFLNLLVRHQSDFEEARETYELDGEMPGMAALDRLCDKLDIEGQIEELAELYVRGEYDPLD